MATTCAVMVNVYKQLGLGTDLHDPITEERIHSMGAMYVDDLDMYTWKSLNRACASRTRSAERNLTSNLVSMQLLNYVFAEAGV